MLTKIVELPSTFSTGESTVQLVATGGRNSRTLRQQTSLHNVKVASESPALDLIRTIEPMLGKTVILIIGLGDSETYGPNRRGDAFPSEPIPGRISPSEVLTKHYQSYDKAHVFRHHINNDPAGAIGKVIKAFWNPYMRRVEVVQYLDNDKAPDILARLTGGQPLATSMGCLVAGTQITLADGSRKAVEDITVGDRVLTHERRPRPVTELHRRPYVGGLVTVRAEALEPLTVTTEHPFLVARRSALQSPVTVSTGVLSGYRWREDAHVDSLWIHADCLDPEEHMLLTPIPTEVATPDYATRAFARIFGYYMAEGHIVYDKNKKPSAVHFSTHVDDFIHDELDALAAEYRTKNTPWSYAHPASVFGREIQIADAELAARCLALGGQLAKGKRLAESVLLWHPDVQREFLGAFANGDGHSPSSGGQAGTLKLSTSNRGLAEQLVLMLHRIGAVPSVSTLCHKAGVGFSRTDTWEHVIHLGKFHAQNLRDVCQKVVPADVTNPRQARKIVDGYVVSPIRELTREDAEIDVYNFEVEEDESYVGGSVVLHNCRVPFDVCTSCGNRAVTRAEYCSHLRDHMGEILPDGTQHAALNPSPDFFDSSLVTRPADRNGYVLRKVADANTGRVHELWTPSPIRSADIAKIASELRMKAASLRKLSDIEKTLSGTVGGAATGTPDGTLTLISRYAQHAMPPEGCAPTTSGAGYEVSFKPRVEKADAEGAEIKVASLGGLLAYAMKTAGVITTPELVRASLAHAGEVQAIFAEYPRFYDHVCKVANIRDDVTGGYHKAETALAPYVDISNVLGSNNTVMRPLTDKLTYTDPHGHTYETTVGMANRARNFDTAANQTRPLQLGLSAIGQGNIFGNAGHRALLHRPSKEMMTNEGENILSNTEMVRTASAPSELPPLEMRAIDFRVRDGRPAKLASAARDSLWAAVRDAEITDDLSDALGCMLDLQKVACALGRSVLDAIV